jgi:Holliday junction resolvase RusA-like endonuclease
MHETPAAREGEARSPNEPRHSLILTQPGRFTRLTGPVHVTYSFTPADSRRRDVFNYEKAVSDFLVKHAIIADDSDIRRGTVEWAEGQPGVIVTVESVKA